MKNCGANDFFEVRKQALPSSLFMNAMSDLYLPLIGANAFAAYFALWGEGKTPSTHAHLLQKLQLSPGQFYQAMLPLEAMGLVKTYYQEDETTHYFIYCLRSPVEPNRFLSDVLYRGTLEKYVGEAEVRRLLRKYKVDVAPADKSFQDVGTSFSAFFSPNLSDPVFRVETNARSKEAKVKTVFDFREFSNALLEKGIRSETLSQEEIDTVARFSALYCLDSKLIAGLVSDCYRGSEPSGSRIDMESFGKRCRDSLDFPYLRQESAQNSPVTSESVDANLIKIMDKLSPAAFLTYLQKKHKPAASDLKLLSHLASDLGLSDPAINALLWFTLQKNGNELPYGFADKVGASLIREGCQTARDAWDYLSSSSKKRQRPVSFRSPKKTVDFLDKGNEPQLQSHEHASDADVDAALSELFGSKKR